ncbi:MAG TPA: hypothetical protein VGN20_01605 [Mucilaginibacter sp.]|jgi:hypothetical protein
MKKILLTTVISILVIQHTFSQTGRVKGPVELKMTDSLCSCVEKIDLSKISNKADAMAAYVACVEKHMDILKDLAAERKVDISNKDSMEKVGIDLAMNLLNKNCSGFKQLALTMAGNNKNSDEEISGTATGIFKRIENKGFNYFVIADGNNKEKSFIWLRQFTGSESFMNSIVTYAGKKIMIKYQEIEVYLPAAKGYYKIKEITSVEFL